MVIAGLVGLQSGFNIAPTFVWITWWVGLSFFTAFVGNVWPLVNPWRVLFDWAEGLARRFGYRDGLELGQSYPEALGIWPAVGLYLVFVWIENVFSGSYVPRNIALFALAYALITLYGMAFFGKETWLRRGEAFSVFFGLLGRFAPTEVRVKDPAVCLDCDGCDNAGRVRELLRVLRQRRACRARTEPAPSCGRSRTAREGAPGRDRVRYPGAGRRDFRRPARDPAVARDRTPDPGDADARDDSVALIVSRHLSRLCGVQPNPGGGGGWVSGDSRPHTLTRSYPSRSPTRWPTITRT